MIEPPITDSTRRTRVYRRGTVFPQHRYSVSQFEHQGSSRGLVDVGERIGHLSILRAAAPPPMSRSVESGAVPCKTTPFLFPIGQDTGRHCSSRSLLCRPCADAVCGICQLSFPPAGKAQRLFSGKLLSCESFLLKPYPPLNSLACGRGIWLDDPRRPSDFPNLDWHVSINKECTPGRCCGELGVSPIRLGGSAQAGTVISASPPI